MSFLRSPSLFQTLSPNHGDDVFVSNAAGKLKEQKRLRPTSSFANLIKFVRNPLENVGEAVEDWYDGTSKEERERKQAVEDRKQLLYLKMRTATSHTDWEAAAKELDELEDNNDWKAVFDSPDYNAKLVEARLKQLNEARISCDVGRMLFLIRTEMTRDLGNMGNLRMYKHTHIGTKDLIERYITSALETLDALLDVSARAKCDGLESKYIMEQVLFARQAFGRSALLLSGGGTFGMNHMGVLKALWEAKMLPRIISGASAGSIVSAVICTRVDEEISQLLETFCDGDLAVFEEEGNEDGVIRKIARFLKQGALFDIGHLTRVMKEMLGELTFQEAYNRTRKILNICVSSASLFELPRLLNYITAPNVLIWSAVAASCSVPCVYTAALLLAKDPKTGEAVPWNPSRQYWIDGSVDNDIPMVRLAEMFNVNHFIVSQVNPHVVPFLIRDEDAIDQEAKKATTARAPGPTWFHSLSQLAKSEALYRMHTLADLGILPYVLTKTVSVLSQRYSGDITILPEVSYADFPRILSNPTPEFMHQAMLSGERATWPKMSIIKNHCAIELALDDTVQKLRARVAFSPSEVELRMSTRPRLKNSDIRKEPTGRRTRLKRQMSQQNTSSVPIPIRQTIHTPNQNATSRVAPSLRRRKSLSIDTILQDQPATVAISTEGPKTDYLNHKRSLQDITSSGADEESNLASSSSTTSLSWSSPTDSPSSPTDSEVKWNRSIFQSSSGPATPSQNPTFSMSAIKPIKSSLSMTPAKSLSESRYKRLFHRRPSAPADISGTDTETGSGGQTSSRPSMKRNWTMDIDIPNATKSLFAKAKRKSATDDWPCLPTS
ncbi:hypothetical protein MMC28_003787 [Mycoblastus sanguinarius]|nr:hypothetical protein [Mycoblastus sanguinarius]